MKRNIIILLFLLVTVGGDNAFAQCEWPCTVNAGSDKTSLCPGNAVTIGVSGCLSSSDCKPGCSYTVSWSPSGGTACTATVYPTVTTTYTMTVTLNGSCCPAGATGSCNTPPGATCSNGVTRTDQVTVTVNSTGCRIINPGIVQEESNSAISLSPNPTSGHFNLTLNDDLFKILDLSKSTPIIGVYDVNGKLIIQSDITGKINPIDISSYSAGTYFIKLIDGDTLLGYKVLIKS
ncbi:MAG: T9SS type A sorting domain-containing protein [Bacteroidia bacterium]|nr:T9SS type A sorting domain-containing protein [Bacteroidia bacterium]